MAFSDEVRCMTRLTQGCLPVTAEHTITRADDVPQCGQSAGSLRADIGRIASKPPQLGHS